MVMNQQCNIIVTTRLLIWTQHYKVFFPTKRIGSRVNLGFSFLLKIMMIALMSPNHQYCNDIIDQLTWWPNCCIYRKKSTHICHRQMPGNKVTKSQLLYLYVLYHIHVNCNEIHIICSHIISWVVYIYNHIIQTWASAITHLYLSKVCAQLIQGNWKAQN